MERWDRARDYVILCASAGLGRLPFTRRTLLAPRWQVRW
jgi:hypothetical protein